MFLSLLFVLLIASTVSATEENSTEATNHIDTTYSDEQALNVQHTDNIEKTLQNNITKKSLSENKESDDNITGKKDVLVSIDSLVSGKINENLTVTGTFKEVDGKTISNSNVRLFLNGNKYFSRTDKTGTYVFTTKITTAGINNLSVGYGGNDKYNPFETNTTFNVYKYDITITHNTIPDTLYKNNYTITGKFTTTDGKPLSNSNVKIIINNKKYLARTDKTGTYTLTQQATTLGTNNITIGYSGNDKLNPYETNTTFNVYKYDITITHNTIPDTLYKNNYTITGKFTTTDGKPLSNSNVKIIINNKKYLARTDKTGTYTLTQQATTLGTNNITIGYSGNDKLNPYETNTTFNVYKCNVTVTYDRIKDVYIGSNITVKGKFITENGKPISNSNVRIFFNGVKYFARTNDKGEYIFTNMTHKLGENNLSIGYGGNDKLNSFSADETFDVLEKMEPDIRLASSNITPGKDKTFFIMIGDATGTITLKINDTVIADNVELEDGSVFYRFHVPEDFRFEKYNFTVIYNGDFQYNPGSAQVTLTLVPEGGKVNSTMNLDNFTVKYSLINDITVNLDDNAFGNIIFTINNKNNNYTETVEFENGTCVYHFNTNITPGVYNLTANYTGCYMYRPICMNSTLIIEKLNSKVSTVDVSSKAGNLTLFTARVVDEFGNPLQKMNVNFSLNNDNIGFNRTDEDGNVELYHTLSYRLYDKQYTIFARSIASDTIANDTANATLTLNQLKTRTLVPNISSIPSRYTTLTATIVDEFNNPVLKGNVTFKKDNTTITTVEVAEGYVKYQYESNFETASSSHIYAIYEGDWKYADSEGNGTYVVNKLKTTTVSSSLEAKPNSEIKFNARLFDEIQNSVTEGNVTFKINNITVGTAEVKNGYARLTYNLKDYAVGEYVITTEYSGSSIFKDSSAISVLKVSRYGVIINGNSINAIVGNYTTITLEVFDEEKYHVETGTVEFSINSEYIGRANVTKGYVNFEYLVPSKYDGKTVRYYATYLTNDLYDSSSYSNTMLVSHQNIVYVSPKGNDSNLGDEQHPFKTLEYAIDHITLFGTIYLSEGTYTTKGITLNNSITIIGKGRDTTIIDGLKSGQPIFNMSRRNVVLTLDGVTLQNGKCDKEFSAGAIVTSGKLTIMNSRFRDNTCSGNYSGGAIYTNGILNLTNTEFINNTVTNINSQGGAIRTYDNATYITNCTFKFNKVTGSNSTGASVLYCDSGDLIINGTVFDGNIAQGGFVTGGVIRTIFGAVVIDNSTFTNNQIKATDYGIGGIVGSIGSGILINNSRLVSNTVDGTNSAGASIVYVETAVLEIENSEIRSNKVISKEIFGGAIYGFKAVVNMTNNTVHFNNVNASANAYGGVLYTFEGNLTVDKTKFINNTARAKDMVLAGVLYSDSNVTITDSDFVNNNINASNLGGGAIANMGNLTMTHSNLIDNYAYNAGDAITATEDSVNIIEDNYWNSDNPSWDKLLNGLSQPKSYSKTKFTN